MIAVHVWLPHGSTVGHASAEIGSLKDADHYVSWWPSDANWKKTHPGSANGYAEDIASEGRASDHQRMLHGLDEEAGRAWWAAFRKHGHYGGYRQNCARAVITMLKAAGGDARIGWTRFSTRHNFPLASTFAPQLCAAGVAPAILQARFSGNVSGAMLFADQCTGIWTPLDVLRYADAIAAHK